MLDMLRSTTFWIDHLEGIASALGVFLTLFLWFPQVRQMNIQQKANIIKDQFDAYWKTLEPITADDIADFVNMQDEYFDPAAISEEMLSACKSSPRSVILAMRIHEFMVFLDAYHKIGFIGPLDPKWKVRWIRDILSQESTSVAFLSIARSYKDYYPEFYRLVEAVQSDPPSALSGQGVVDRGWAMRRLPRLFKRASRGENDLKPHIHGFAKIMYSRVKY